MLKAFPEGVRQNATSLLVFTGPPNVSVKWTLTGVGTLTPKTNFTDETGNALATYTPGNVGDTVTISVTHGT